MTNSIGKHKWIIFVLIMFICVGSYCRFAIGRFKFSPQAQICENLTTAGLMDRSDCIVDGRPTETYIYMRRYFKEGEVNLDYVETAMTGFKIDDVFNFENGGSYIEYQLAYDIFGYPGVWVTFYFDKEEVLTDYGISN